jgi:two-component system response regulator AtoC
MVEAGSFRADLFYRLNVLRIHIPPLRERREDVAILADQFLARLGRRSGRPVEPLERATLDALEAYAWPGNVRELENTLERAVILARGERVRGEHLPFAPASVGRTEAAPAHASADGEDVSIKRRGRALEQRLIRLALARTRGNRTRAAELLEISARALQYKLKEYAIDPLNPVPPGSDI